MEVYNADREEQQMTAQNEILQQYSDASDKVVTAALKNEEIKLKHSEKMMGHDHTFRELQSTHRKAISRYEFGVGRTQARFDGYQSEYQAAGEIINIS